VATAPATAWQTPPPLCDGLIRNLKPSHKGAVYPLFEFVYVHTGIDIHLCNRMADARRVWPMVPHHVRCRVHAGWPAASPKRSMEPTRRASNFSCLTLLKRADTRASTHPDRWVGEQCVCLINRLMTST
jgi:hypothetical protein